MAKHVCILIMLAMAAIVPAHAQSDDFGIWYSLGAEKKISKNLSVGAETEFRTRNDAKTADRWSTGIEAEYKIIKGVKASAGYTFLYDNNMEKLSYNYDEVVKNLQKQLYGVDVNELLTVDQSKDPFGN